MRLDKLKDIRPSTYAWTGILAGVSLYELTCPQGETLSERLDPLLEGRAKYLVLGGIAVTAAHLINLIPERVDPFEQGLSRIRQSYKRRSSEQ